MPQSQQVLARLFRMTLSGPMRPILAMLALLVTTVQPANAQGLDLTLFLGRAYPVYDERLQFAPSLPALPRVSVTETGQLTITTKGGPVFGAALAFELGIVGIEGRLDATDIRFAVNGTRYDLFATAPILARIGSISIGEGRFAADRLNLVSLNVRLRTPGPIAVVASGGLSYLPGVSIEGTLPVAVETANAPSPSGVDARLRLIATPGEPEHRWGLNGGAGVRIGGRRVALMVEARAFYFREFQLRFATAGPDLLSAVVTGISPVRFEPVIVNAQGGVVFRF
jgi:hypothetical protein